MNAAARAASGSLRALALQPVAPVPSLATQLTLFGLHLAGLLLAARLAHWPWWLALLLLAGFSLPQIVRRRVARHGLAAEMLAPLVVLYGAAGLRLLLAYGFGRAAPPALDYELALGLSGVWSALVALKAVGRLRLAWVAAGLAAALLMAVWLWQRAPAGVTGSDPFAYVQMAIDLAEHGRLRHSFPLAPLADSLGLPTLPVTHVGYVLPNEAGLAPTVWPAGYSALLAVAYRLAGERALLTFNVWVGLASLGLTALLAALVCPPGWRRSPLLAGAAAAVLVATSPEQLVRLVVPLADGAAQALTAVAVVIALLVVRRGSPPWLPWTYVPSVMPVPRAAGVREMPGQPRGAGSDGERVEPGQPRGAVPSGGRSSRRAGWVHYAALGALAGACLALAFSVRYTQLLIAPGLLLAAWYVPGRGGRRWAYLLGLASAALLVAMPDLVYRTRLYGWPWRFGTGELALFSVGALPGALRGLAEQLLAGGEFGWLWPLALLGGVYLWRRSRPAALVLAAAYGPPLLFHLWYPFLRLRDVLFTFPSLAALAALGGALVLGWLRGLPGGLATAGRLAAVAALLALGTARMLPLLSPERQIFTFGYLRPEQRSSLEALDALTEPNAVIASSLNSGAVELYGRRLAVRPGNVLQPGASWSEAEWLTFAAALLAEGRPLYMLMDSPELEAPLDALRAVYIVAYVADLEVPVYYHGGGSQNLTVPLWRVIGNR